MSTNQNRFSSSPLRVVDVIVLVASALIAVRVVDDAFLRPAAGLSAGDNLASGVVPLALLTLAVAGYLVAPLRLRSLVALTVGVVGVMAGAEVFADERAGHSFGGDDQSAVVSIAAGAVLVVTAGVLAWTTRLRSGPWWVAGLRRAGLVAVVGGLCLTLYLPIALAFMTTHASGPGLVDPPSLGAPVSRVELRTSDGLTITGWYAPSRNGASVIVLPGRSGRDHARMLVEAGYGALLLNRRGEGDSDGDPHLYGWGGGRDVSAAAAYLGRRPDVRNGAIGALGLSVGGEVLLQHAAQHDDLRAVVSEGAGSRSVLESLELTGGIRLAELLTGPALTATLLATSDEPVPPNLVELLRSARPQHVMVIWGGEGQPAEKVLSAKYANALGTDERWEVPGAPHIGGLDTAPEEYRDRVIGFLDRSLLDAR